MFKKDIVFGEEALRNRLALELHRPFDKGKLKYTELTESSPGEVEKAMQVANFIRAATDEIKAIARICGKNDIHGINKNDLIALTPEMARITGVDLA